MTVAAGGRYEVGANDQIGTLNSDGTTALEADLTVAGLAGGATGTLELGGGSTLTVEQSVDGTFGGATAGDGAFAKAGAGTLTLTGNGTHGGGTTIDAGTLRVEGALDDDAVVSVGVAGRYTVAAEDRIGSVVNVGALILDATLTASSLQNAGRIALGADLSLDSFINDGLLDVSGPRTLSTAALSGAGSAVIAENGSLTLDLGGAATYGGNFTGAGRFDKSGAGLLSLTGDSDLGGGSMVTAGELRVDGRLAGGLYVASGAALSGMGTIVGEVVSDGAIAPGASPGVLTIDGPLRLGATSVLEFEVDGKGTSPLGGAGTHDRIALVGADSVLEADGVLVVRLRGITGDATNSYVPELGDRLALVTVEGAGGVSGSFTELNVDEGLPASLRYDLIYGPDQLELLTTPAAFEDFGATRNERQVAAAIDRLRPAAGVRSEGQTAGLFDALYVSDAATLSSALAVASGEIHALALDSVREGVRELGRSVSRRAEQGASDSRRSAWFSVAAADRSLGGDGLSDGARSEVESLLIGANLAGSGLRSGFAFGYERGDVLGRPSQDAESRIASVSGWITASDGPWVNTLAAGAAVGSVDSRRSVRLQGTSFDAAATEDLSALWVRADGRYQYALSGEASMFAGWGIEGLRLSADGGSEGGAAATRLTLGDDSWNFAAVELRGGLSASTRWFDREAAWNLEIGGRRSLALDDRLLARDAVLAGESFEITTVGGRTSEMFAALGARLALGARTQLSVRFEGMRSGDRDSINAGIALQRSL